MNWILAQSSSGGFWMPPESSTVAGEVDGLFSFILWVTIFFVVLNAALVTVFIVKYRYRPGREKAEKAPAHNNALELTWTIIPTVIVLIIFYFGFRGFLDMAVAPQNAYKIDVTGSMWNWAFTYPNGYTSNELHIPINEPVRLVLQSPDVIHSLYIPQFRLKKDVVPGRYNYFWVEATQLSPPEGFDVYCAEYCGQGHSTMRSKVIVHDRDDFNRWLEQASNWETRMTPLEAGKMLVESNGCLNCHSIDGSAKNGPTFKDLFGRSQQMSDGSTVVADENYIMESLYDPAAKVVAGFTVQMSTYRGRLKDRDVNAIIAYLQSISATYQATLPPAAAATTTTTQPQ